VIAVFSFPNDVKVEVNLGRSTHLKLSDLFKHDRWGYHRVVIGVKDAL
jgi:hypothetical protein